MPNHDELNAGVQDDPSACGAQVALARWMRIPEAWVALRRLPQAETERIRSPFDLAAFCAARQEGPAAPDATWEDVASMNKQAPIDFNDVIYMASTRSALVRRLDGLPTLPVLSRRSRTCGARPWPSRGRPSPALPNSPGT